MPPTTRFAITDRRPFAGGHVFPHTGAYERLTGRVHLAIDPDAPESRFVTDLALAPRDPDGRVAIAADVMFLAPADPARGNRRLFLDWGNRGAKRALQFFNDATPSNDPLTREHAGNGFLMRRGYTIGWVAWEGDLLPGSGRMTIDLPVARAPDGPITGPVRVEYIVSQPGTTCLPLSGRIAARSYQAATTDPRAATLTRRRYPDDPPEPIPPDAWSYARLTAGQSGETGAVEQAIEPSDTHIHLPAGFEPGWIYELIYPGRDPIVHGLGYVAIREVVAALKHDPTTSPVGPIEKAYAWGRSQTGRTIRDFVYLGANADAAGRRVFDGVLPHVAGAGRAWVNHRFAAPIVAGGQQYEDHFAPADRFPFAYAETTDHLTGRRDAILKRPRHRSAGDPHPDRERILVPPRLPGPHRHARQRPGRAGRRAHLRLGRIAAFRRSAGAGRAQAGLPESVEHGRHVDALPRAAGRDGSLGHRGHEAAALAPSAPGRRHVDRRRRLARALPGDPGRDAPGRAERAAAARFRAGGGGGPAARAAFARGGRGVCGAGAGGG